MAWPGDSAMCVSGDGAGWQGCAGIGRRAALASRPEASGRYDSSCGVASRGPRAMDGTTAQAMATATPLLHAGMQIARHEVTR